MYVDDFAMAHQVLLSATHMLRPGPTLIAYDPVPVLKTNLKKELDLLQRLKFECKCAAEQISYNDMMIKRISHSPKDETAAPVKRFSCATLDKWIQRSVKRKGGSSSKGKENMVPYDEQPKESEFERSDGELGYQVESESLSVTVHQKPFIPKAPSGVLLPLLKKQNAVSPERSEISKSHDHINDGSHKELADTLEYEGEKNSLSLAGNHKQFVPKIPSNLVLSQSKKHNTSSISFHYVIEEIISEEDVQHVDK